MEYKTLILIDNSENLTSLNKDIIKQTVRYMLENSPNEMKMAVAQIGTDGYIKYLSDYDDTSQTKINSIDNVSFLTPPVSAMDIVADVILEWKNHDLANRDIIVFSSADVNNMSVYTLEELILELESLNYPVYTVGCIQDDNVSKLKTLASISRVSNGIIVYTDEGSDASVEKQITEKIFSAMNEKRSNEESKTEISESNNNDANGLHNGKGIPVENNYDEIIKDNSHIIYENNKNTDYREIMLVGIVVFFMLFVIVILYKIIKKDKRNGLHKADDSDVNYRNNRNNVNNRNFEEAGSEKLFNLYEETESETRNLIENSYFDNEMDEDSGTRILYQSREGVDITLEDRADPTKYFRANIKDRAIIGRSKKLCDIPVTYDDSVSGKHCELFLRGDSLYVRDLSSSNGTMVNQQKVYQDIRINNGDVLRLGQLSFIVTVRSNMGGYIGEF